MWNLRPGASWCNYIWCLCFGWKSALLGTHTAARPIQSSKGTGVWTIVVYMTLTSGEDSLWYQVPCFTLYMKHWFILLLFPCIDFWSCMYSFLTGGREGALCIRCQSLGAQRRDPDIKRPDHFAGVACRSMVAASRKEILDKQCRIKKIV